jgi:glutathione-specific gamma-glutamylcyclotransferase
MAAKVLGRFSDQLLDEDLWVFGYGSLMWNPEFEHVDQQLVLLRGYHRSLCIHSTRHRGTPEEPGLVLGLAPGGACYGIAFRVERKRVAQTLLALWQREMRSGTYEPRLVKIGVACARAQALAFVADRSHRNFAGALDVGEIARRVVRCRGQRGPNIEYLLNTAAHLQALGVSDRRLARVLAAVRVLRPA